MSGQALAMAHGAATIVNAMASGVGAAFGVDLWTKAEVKLTNEVGLVVAEITSDPDENTLLIQKTVKRVLQRFNLQNSFGASVQTWSNIPIARGLKSSSTAANAVALATTAALGKSLSDIEIVNLGVDAAFDAKVTVTGAFDDACASYFGGIVVTDNLKRQIVRQSPLSEGLSVLFHVPTQKAYSANVDINRLKTINSLVQIAYEQVLQGKIWEALSLNGLIYSSASGYSVSIVVDALAAGAVAAGLCGKGPAVTVVVPKDNVNSVKAALEKYNGDIVQAGFNMERAKVL